MFTVNFENMSDSDGYTLDQLFPGQTEGLTAGRSATAADWIMTWDPTKGTDGGYGTKFFLFYRPEASYADRAYTWRQSQSTPSSQKIKSGMCFWYYHMKPEDDKTTYPIKFSVAGTVQYSQQGTVLTIHPGKNMIGAPFACDLDLNSYGVNFWKDLAESGKVLAGRSATAADWVMSWDPTKGTEGGYGTKYFLFYRPEASYADRAYTWRQSQSTLAPANFIKMGTGAWYSCSGTGFTTNIPYPYDL